MTTDVLIKTLGKYADSNTEIGKKAFAAAQEVTKFTQMWDVLKETAQSGWARTWELIVGDLNTAKSILSEFISDNKNDQSIIDRAIKYAEKRYGVTEEEMKSSKRNAEIIAARHLAVYIIRKTTNLSQNSIARIFNKKDHTTVINSINFIERKMQNEPSFEHEVNNLIAELKS
jgi:hypothetical protein